ncbi:universal stress protein [Streptomyces sp. NPDC059373]
MGSQGTAPARIVVGVDGSTSSEEALRWALRQARLLGGTVDAVIAWEFPAAYGFAALPVDTDVEAAAGAVLAEAVAKVAKDEPGVEIRESVSVGNAARALLDTARGAELLVVGNRGRGGFTEALLGSVSQHCVHHATCPVVVVRDGEG